MKKNRVLKFAALVLVLTLVTSSLVSGTYAKYTTSVTGTDTVTVAKWVANFDETGAASGDFDFDFFETFGDTGVDGDLLAPGTSGSFDLVYDTTGTQVARKIDVSLDASKLEALDYLKFYWVDGDDKTEIAGENAVYSKTIAADATPDKSKGTITVYWEWPFENTPVGIANDAADTIDGKTPIVDAKIKVNFTATQLNTNP